VRRQEDQRPGHCCFTGEDVEAPRLGEFVYINQMRMRFDNFL
jgi:hypothetical protein